jgi:hypothetical protein
VIVNEIRKIWILLSICLSLICGLISFSVVNICLCIGGCIISYGCLLINEKTLDLSSETKAVRKTIFSFIIRILLYVIAYTLAFKINDLTGIISCFVGSLSIRLAILIKELKGGFK